MLLRLSASAHAWFTQRVTNGSKLPNPKAKVAVVNGNAVDTFAVTVTIEWDLPNSGGSDVAADRKNLEHGVYVTQAMLF